MSARLQALILVLALAGGASSTPQTIEKIIRVPCPLAAPTIRCPTKDPEIKGLSLEQGDEAWARTLKVCRAEIRLWREGFAECAGE